MNTVLFVNLEIVQVVRRHTSYGRLPNISYFGVHNWNLWGLGLFEDDLSLRPRNSCEQRTGTGSEVISGMFPLRNTTGSRILGGRGIAYRQRTLLVSNKNELFDDWNIKENSETFLLYLHRYFKVSFMPRFRTMETPRFTATVVRFRKLRLGCFAFQ